MLVFSLKRGQAFYVGDRRVELVQFDVDGADFLVEGEEFRCGNEPTEVWPDVQVSAGERKEFSLRVGIQAPFHIKILREKLYLKSRDGQVAQPEQRACSRKVYSRAAGCKFCKGTMTWKVDGKDLPCPAAQNPALPICSDAVE